MACLSMFQYKLSATLVSQCKICKNVTDKTSVQFYVIFSYNAPYNTKIVLKNEKNSAITRF